MSVELSVLICSTHTRYDTFGRAIQDQVWGQLAALPPEDQARVEVLMLTDNKAMMLGHKRNILVDAAQGRYVVFVDDDDRLEPDYLSRLLAATATNADVITFLVSVRLNGGEAKMCHYSIKYAADRNTATSYQRLPNHICAVKRELAAKVSFPNIAYGEDSAYSKLLKPHLRTEEHIDAVLYHYDYDSESTETQQHLKAKMRTRAQPPLVDVVMLSNAQTPKLQRMTQRAIDTCIAGANSLPVNIIVVEQSPRVKYSRASTIRAPREFHYNRFANEGIRQGSAPWVMVANNDLVFHDGWLHQLLAAEHPVVSPKCPRDPRQREITENTCGYENAVHFSGWCFMLQRDLWKQIGGFDECVSFWFSDDVVLEQLSLVGQIPMMVPAAKVEHLQSVTLRLQPPDIRDEMTWSQVHTFNTRYGRNKFADDPRYQKWKATHAQSQ